MNRLLAVILLACALALPALPVHADPGTNRDLFEASQLRTASEVKAALAAGADPNARKRGGDTPLHLAAIWNDNPSVITALIEGGADPGARVRLKRRTPLHLAARFNDNPSVIAALIEGGADPGARDDDGETPLHAAAELNNNLSVIAALIEGGANPGARDDDGETPLHAAAMETVNPSVITALIEAGADPGARDGAGNTPFDYAKENVALKGTDAYRLLNEPYPVHADDATDDPFEATLPPVPTAPRHSPSGSAPESADPGASVACQIEDWRWQYVEFYKMIFIEGTTTCETGKITIRAYDGNGKFVGTGWGFIEGHVLTIMPIMDIVHKPRSLNIKSAIEP